MNDPSCMSGLSSRFCILHHSKLNSKADLSQLNRVGVPLKDMADNHVLVHHGYIPNGKTDVIADLHRTLEYSTN